jgi:CHASE2 domain-containing sensor protein
MRTDWRWRLQRALYRSPIWELSEIPLGILLCLLALNAFLHPGKARNQILDALLAVRAQEPAQLVRLVKIDDWDYEHMFAGRSPLDANKLADLLTLVARANPRAIDVDIDTSQLVFAGDDDKARGKNEAAFWAKLNNIKVPVVWNTDAQPIPGTGVDLGLDLESTLFALKPALGGRAMREDNFYFALAMTQHDEQGQPREYLREYRGGMQLGEKIRATGPIESPAHRILLILSQDKAGVLSADENQRQYEARYSFQSSYARDVQNDADNYGDAWDKVMLYQNSVVVIGGAFRAARDRYSTPKGTLWGCEVVAGEIEAELSGTSLGIKDGQHLWWTILSGGVLYIGLRMPMALHRRRAGRLGAAQLPRWMAAVGSGYAVLPLSAAVVAPLASWELHLKAWQAFWLYPAILLVLFFELYSFFEILKAGREFMILALRMWSKVGKYFKRHSAVHP